jgi:hypothetical protein
VIFEKNLSQQQGERNLGDAKLRRRRQINPAHSFFVKNE